MSEKGLCKHGGFVLTEGCPQCIEKRTGEGIPPGMLDTTLIKVQYYSETTGGVKPREYTYYSVDRVAVGDIVTVPVRDTGATVKAMVSAIDVPEAEIASFKDKVKTIPAGSVLGKLVGEDIVLAEATLLVPTEEALPPADTTEVTLRPGEDTEARGYFQQSEKALKYAVARIIATDEDNKLANDDLAIISGLKKAMLAKKKEYLDPLLNDAKLVRESYEYLMSPVLEAERITKDKMLAYNADQKRIRQEQEDINRKRIEAAQQEVKLKGEISEPLNLVEVMPEPAKTVSTDMGTSGQRDNWKYEIEDEDALPREYMIPSTVMLNAIAKSYHDQKKIPGVRFFNSPIIATRAR